MRRHKGVLITVSLDVFGQDDHWLVAERIGLRRLKTACGRSEHRDGLRMRSTRRRDADKVILRCKECYLRLSAAKQLWEHEEQGGELYEI